MDNITPFVFIGTGIIMVIFNRILGALFSKAAYFIQDSSLSSSIMKKEDIKKMNELLFSDNKAAKAIMWLGIINVIQGIIFFFIFHFMV